MADSIKKCFFINVGLLLVALEINFIMVPNKLSVGGISGLSIILRNMLPFIPTGALMLGINIILLLLGFILIGSSFGAGTIYCSITLSGMVFVLEKLFPLDSPLTDDMFVEFMIAIILSALGTGLIFSQNASTGGTDIIAKILNKYFGFNIGMSLLMADLAIVVLSAATFGIKKGMYSALGVVINGFFIDYVINRLNTKKEVIVISSKNDKIKEYILNGLNRGATLQKSYGAFSNCEQLAIRSILGKKDLTALKAYVKKVDPEAFITVNSICEIYGKGFRQL